MRSHHQQHPRKQFTRRLILFALITFSLLPPGRSAPAALAAPATLSGTVYQDYNGNGRKDDAASAAFPNAQGGRDYVAAIDTGVSAVTVTAYDASGAVAATTTSAANGTYTLTGLDDTQAYRIEFSGLPAGYESGANRNTTNAGANTSGSSVQFVASGNATNVDFGVNIPPDFCQNNPNIAVNCLRPFAQTVNPSAPQTALYQFPYAHGSTAATGASYSIPPPASVVRAQDVGTTLGLAYNRFAQRLYAAAFMKRHAGLGVGADNTINTADDPGAVYILDPAQTNAAAVIGTITVPGATTNPHQTANYFLDGLTGASTGPSFDGVGKNALGGVAVSDDGTQLFVMNLENRTLYAYALNAATGQPTGAPPTLQTVPGLPAVGGSAADYNANNPATTGARTCADGDIRPFSVTYYRAQVYVGIVCAAESTNNLLDLWAYVYTVDPVSLAFATTPVFSFALNYPRNSANDPVRPGDTPAQAATRADASANWNPWNATFQNVTNIGAPFNSLSYPQPMLTSIAFDRGNMVLGLRDRMGDQGGNQTPSNPAALGTDYRTVAAGDTLRACGSPPAWVLESNGQCGGSGPTPAVQAQFAAAGPGIPLTGGEFYYRDEYSYYTNGNASNYSNTTTDIGTYTNVFRNHDEVSIGSVSQVPGFPDVVSTAFDPIPVRDPAAAEEYFHDGGLRWWSNTDGALKKAYRIYDGTDNINDVPGTFGKANGFGGIVMLCDTAPVEIGNRLWRDDNRNGVQDAGEPPIAGVTVQLFNSANALQATAVTDANGNYLFSSDTRIVAQGGAASTASAVYSIAGLTQNTAGFQVRVATGQAALAGLTLTTPDSDASPNGDSRDSDAALNGANAVITVNTGRSGQNNHTLDIGFYAPYSIGNRVWFDADNSGTINGAEVGVNAVAVQLFRADAAGNPTGAPIATDTTKNGGYYRFDNLPTGRYVVVLPNTNFGTGAPLAGYLSSGPTTADPTLNRADSDDNGIDNAALATNGIRSGLLVLRPSDGEPTGAGEPDRGTPASYGTGTEAADNRSNLTVDFGFYRLTIGDTVWADDNDDGIFNEGPGAGLSGVTVALLDGAGNPVLGPTGLPLTTTTDANGNYQFSGLLPGTYIVRITPPAGYVSSTGNGGLGTATDDDVGTPNGAFIDSSPFTLQPGSAAFNATSDTATATTTNPQLDFGLVAIPTYSLGNRIWFDTNNDGALGAGEVGVAGVRVSLLDSAGNPVLSAGVPVTTITGAGGYYRFDNLAAGDYRVQVDAANFAAGGLLAGYFSSSPDEVNPNADVDSNDNGIGGTPSATGIRSGSVTIGPGTAEPTNDTDVSGTAGGAANNRSNLTVDFGFYTLTLGNTVWSDTNNNGRIDSGEPGLGGVTVNLLDSNGVVIATQQTQPDGSYLFTGLAFGTYQVQIVPPAGYISSTGANGAASGPYEGVGLPAPLTGDSDDSGTQSGSVIVSPLITLTPSSPGATPNNATGTTSNPTVDFGLFPPYSLGNRVWRDTDNSGTINNGEQGIAGVKVNLFVDANGDGVPDSATPIASLTTGPNGYYRFDNLVPGTYVVQIDQVNFAAGGPLVGLFSSGPTSGSSADDAGVSVNDNGINSANPASGGILSNPVTLTPSGLPAGEPNVTYGAGATTTGGTPAPDARNDLTIDFGFFNQPTALTLLRISAAREGSGGVTVRWTTADERDTLGFHIYRSASGRRADAARVTPTLIAAQGGRGGGASYVWSDASAAPGVTYTYWVEETDVSGGTTTYGSASTTSVTMRVFLPLTSGG